MVPGDEIHDLADAVDDRYRLMVLLRGYAGLRLGELAALRVSSFGVWLRTVTVTESLSDAPRGGSHRPTENQGECADAEPAGVPGGRARAAHFNQC